MFLRCKHWSIITLEGVMRETYIIPTCRIPGKEKSLRHIDTCAIMERQSNIICNLTIGHFLSRKVLSHTSLPMPTTLCQNDFLALICIGAAFPQRGYAMQRKTLCICMRQRLHFSIWICTKGASRQSVVWNNPGSLPLNSILAHSIILTTKTFSPNIPRKQSLPHWNKSH